jgi:hypothetical protein
MKLVIAYESPRALEGPDQGDKDGPWSEMLRDSLLHEKGRRHPDTMSVLVIFSLP